MSDGSLDAAVSWHNLVSVLESHSYSLYIANMSFAPLATAVSPKVHELSKCWKLLALNRERFPAGIFNALQHLRQYLHSHVPDNIAQTRAFLIVHRSTARLISNQLSDERLPKLDPEVVHHLNQFMEGLENHFRAALDSSIKRWREKIQSGQCAQFKALLQEHSRAGKVGGQGTRTDSADIVFDLVMGFIQDKIPQKLEDHMHHYEPTPIRLVLGMLEGLALSERDHLCDLGSGLGRLATAAALFTRANVTGIEYQRILYRNAQSVCDDFGLSKLKFLNMDVRLAPFGDANVFYLFNPFDREIVRPVIWRLRQQHEALSREGTQRQFLLCSLGASSQLLEKELWLKRITAPIPSDFQLFTPQS